MLSKDGFFTLEQDKWLIEHYPYMPKKEVVIEFNKVFGTDRNMYAISDRATKRLKIHRVDNTGQYGIRKPKELPIGTIRKSQVGTYIKVKNADGAKMTGYQKPYWMPLQEKIYTDKYGELKDGYMVCFLDNDRDNFEIDNLYAINRQISAVMSANRWWTDNRVATLTAIKWCELFYAMKGD